MDNQEIFLTLSNMFEYLEATHNSRSFVEGEQVLNSRHLILCGICDRKCNAEGAYSAIKLLALCLQTSALLTGKPHEISGWLEVDPSGGSWKILPFSCTCKAGASGKCKHISATLLKCTRADVLTLETLSGTDVECYWRTHKKEVGEYYEARPIRDTCCVKKMTEKKHCRPLSQDEKERCFLLLTSSHPDSALSKHIQGRRIVLKTINAPEIDLHPSWLDPLIVNIQESTFLPDLNLDVSKYDLRDCCKTFYSTLCDVDITKIILTCGNGSEGWKIHRKYRLTGSRCYSIFTYKLTDWNKKSTNYFFPKGFTNKFVQHGILHEKDAQECYKQNLQVEVIEPGFIICERYPWLGYSPDGIVIHEGKPSRLIEIKCPFVGKTKNAIEFIHECSYLEISMNGVRLKKKHAYYGQVQLGMALLNLNQCDFILYSTYSKSFLNITVAFDEDFASELIKTITSNYFNHMIHVICGNKQDNE